MTRLISESFNFWPISSPIVGTVTEDTTHARNGESCAACAPGGFNLIENKLTPTLGRRYFYRFAARVSALPSSTDALWRCLDSTGTVLEISISTSGVVNMWNGVTAAHPVGKTATVAAEEWFVVEVMAQVNSTGKGILSWRLNGVEMAAEQEMSIRNLGINKSHPGNSSSSASIIYLDDVTINDDQGGTNNSWIGLNPDSTPIQKPRYWGADIAETEASGPCEPAPYNEKIWDEFEAAAERKVGIVHMGDPWHEEAGPEWDGYFTGASDRIHAREAIPMKSLGGPSGIVQKVIAGDYDTAIIVWAEKARNWKHPFFLRLWWEMNGNWFPWGRDTATGEEYCQAWRHFHSLVKPIAPNCTFVWCCNAIFNPEIDDPFAAGSGNHYPGDDYVDWVGMDGYTGQNPAVPLGWRTSKEIFLETYQRLEEETFNKPVMICETSASEWFTKSGSEPPHKAEWIRQLLEWTLPYEMPNVRALVWFNWYIEHEKGRVDWPIQSSPSATAAFAAGINHFNYLAPSVSEFPDLNTVPLPGTKFTSNSLTTGIKSKASKTPIEITDEFTEPLGEWSGYSAIPVQQDEALHNQKHVDIRSFIPDLLGAQVTMFIMDRLTMFGLDSQEMGVFSSDAGARIIIINNEGWTFGEVGPQEDRNNWNGISVTCDPSISEVTTTQSVITQNG